MAQQTEYVVVAPDGPCPCRSGRITAECCMASDGTFRVRFFSPLPAGEITGHASPNCFMRDSRNCSEDVAAGPYLSGHILDLVRATTLRVDFPWDDAGHDTAVRVENLTADILCSRHNAALASLDAIAVQTVTNIVEAMMYVTMKSLATKKALYAVSGEGFELWALKLFFGAAASEDRSVDFGIFQRALESGALAPPRGLYVRRPSVEGIRQSRTIPNRLAGLRLHIGPLECELIFDITALDLEAIRRENFYRPSSIDLTGKKRGANIFMSGPGFATNESARLTMWERGPGERLGNAGAGTEN